MDNEPIARDVRVDFARGLALLVIYSNHIPHNSLSQFTPSHFGISDMADVFVFLSGYVSGISYGRCLSQKGLGECYRRIIRRSIQLLLAYGITKCLLFFLAIWMTQSANSTWNYWQHVNSSTIGASGSILGILPMYVIFLLLLPPALILMRKSIVLFAFIFFNIYAFATIVISDSSVVTWTFSGFNPLAWQLPFFAAAFLGANQTIRNTLMPCRGIVLVLSGVVLECVFLYRLFWPHATILLSSKIHYGLTRFIYLWCLIIVGWHIFPCRTNPVLESWFGQALSICGRNSLAVFCTGVVLTSCAHIVLLITDYDLTWQVVVNLIGWLFCVLVATISEQCVSGRINSRILF